MSARLIVCFDFILLACAFGCAPDHVQLKQVIERGTLEEIKVRFCNKSAATMRLYSPDDPGVFTTPLHLAIINGRVDVVSYLCSIGAELRDLNVYEDPAAFNLARSARSRDEVRAMIAEFTRQGFEINERCHRQETLLMRAAIEGNTIVVCELLEAGARPDLETRGMTALDFAVRKSEVDKKSRREIIEALSKAGTRPSKN